MKLPTKTIERALFQAGYRSVIGVDEVGMGCLAGPVVVCAVAFTSAFYERTHARLFNLRDSKLLSEVQRERFARALLEASGLRYRLSFCRPETIDRMNIYQAARHAMRRAVGKLETEKRSFVLVDGDKEIAGLDRPQRAVIKGDRKVFAIACASVIAKVARDRMMVRYAKKFPGYGFDVHKGYGTKNHVAKLAVLGPCAIHRRSFGPVNSL